MSSSARESYVAAQAWVAVLAARLGGGGVASQHRSCGFPFASLEQVGWAWPERVEVSVDGPPGAVALHGQGHLPPGGLFGRRRGPGRQVRRWLDLQGVDAQGSDAVQNGGQLLEAGDVPAVGGREVGARLVLGTEPAGGGGQLAQGGPQVGDLPVAGGQGGAGGGV
jgi:hypothetical protein